MSDTVTLVADAQHLPPERDGVGMVMTFDELRSEGLRALLLHRLWRVQQARLLVPNLTQSSPSLKALLVVRLLARRTCWIEDHDGRREAVTAPALGRRALGGVRGRWRRMQLARRLRRRLDEFGQAPHPARFDPALPPLYVRTDLVFGLRAGGAISHTAGVINGLASLGHAPIVVTPAPVPTVAPAMETHVVPPEGDAHGIALLPQLAYSDQATAAALRALDGRVPGFVYQRSSLLNVSGMSLGRRLGVPLVLEFNGSDVWVARNWGTRLPLEDLAQSVEHANLRGAHLVTVVSDALKDVAIQAGCDERRILVNPNAVDLERFHPGVDGQPVRDQLGVQDDELVVGFIGTFGRWHGAEILAEAFALVRTALPEIRVRLLMVGDGLTRPATEATLARHGATTAVKFTGVVPAHAAPGYLAACDVLVSPHLPNADGTPFFGSPTKLFEYLAMGKPIVASRLDQIETVLDHGRTALLVEPADPADLASALVHTLTDADLRVSLGTAARQAALSHSWESHVQRILHTLARVMNDHA